MEQAAKSTKKTLLYVVYIVLGVQQRSIFTLFEVDL